jgi:hypothetical protein
MANGGQDLVSNCWPRARPGREPFGRQQRFEIGLDPR